VFKMLDHSCSRQEQVLTDDHVIEYIRRGGFFTHSQLRWARLNWPLLTTQIDKWRPETSTFHLRHGEMTITLQDVTMLLGPKIDNSAVSLLQSQTTEIGP